jgi:hypothetical protein
MPYANTSPYSQTKYTRNGALGIFSPRFIPETEDDILYTIEPVYNYRPDLLAFDVYETPKLWWVFAQRNMDILKDPVFDFKTGTQIYLPKKSTLLSVLGV